MIKLINAANPQVLIDNDLKWSADLMDDFYKNIAINKLKQNRYNHPAIKRALILETKEKCAYCESKITHTYLGNIEYIIPKSKYPRLTFSRKNLTLGCFWCNNKKRDFLQKGCMVHISVHNGPVVSVILGQSYR